MLQENAVEAITTKLQGPNYGNKKKTTTADPETICRSSWSTANESKADKKQHFKDTLKPVFQQYHKDKNCWKITVPNRSKRIR